MNSNMFLDVAARDSISPTRRNGVTNPVVKVADGTPKTFSLHQNYPNPFNPSATIAFEVPKESRVTLKIFNILGQEVMTVADEVYAAGTHRVVFNASQLSSGIYFYQLRAGDYVQTRKMILMK